MITSRQRMAMIGVALVSGALAGCEAPETRLNACKTNLKTIGTALERYSTDHSGKYPGTLAALTPTYLKTIPLCPSTGTDTYSAGAKFGPDAPLNQERWEDYYYLFCQGTNHGDAGLKADEPSYNGIAPMKEDPSSR